MDAAFGPSHLRVGACRHPTDSYALICSFVAPCQPGASPLSVRRRVPPRAAGSAGASSRVDSRLEGIDHVRLPARPAATGLGPCPPAAVGSETAATAPQARVEHVADGACTPVAPGREPRWRSLCIRRETVGGAGRTSVSRVAAHPGVPAWPSAAARRRGSRLGAACGGSTRLNRSGLLRTQTLRTTDEPRVEQVPDGVAEHV